MRLEFSYLGEKYIFSSGKHSIFYINELYMSYNQNLDHINLFLTERYLVLVVKPPLFKTKSYYFTFADNKEGFSDNDSYTFIDLEEVEELKPLRSIYSILGN